MKHSKEITELAAAFLKAQKMIIKTVPHFQYTSLAGILNACEEQLNNNGISVLQATAIITRNNNAVWVIETMLLHSSGEWISGELPIANLQPNDQLTQGRAIDDARGYALAAMTGVCPNDDGCSGAMTRHHAGRPQDTPVFFAMADIPPAIAKN